MSIEWLTATQEPAAVLTEGAKVYQQEYAVSAPFAIQFGMDDGAVIEGTRRELLQMLERARQLVLDT